MDELGNGKFLTVVGRGFGWFGELDCRGFEEIVGDSVLAAFEAYGAGFDGLLVLDIVLFWS